VRGCSSTGDARPDVFAFVFVFVFIFVFVVDI